MKPSHVAIYTAAALFGHMTSVAQTVGGYHTGQAFQGVNAFAILVCVFIAAILLTALTHIK